MIKPICVIFGLLFTNLIGITYMLIPFLPFIFISRPIFHYLSDLSIKIWFGLMVWFLEKFLQIKIYFHESNKNKSKNDYKDGSLVIMNHRTRLDWLYYFSILYRLNALMRLKIILKDQIKKVPGIG